MNLPALLQILATPLLLLGIAARHTERRLVRGFASVGAISAASAITVAQPNRLRRWQLARLARHGAVIAAGGDRYYFSAEGYGRFRAARRRRVAVLVPLILLAGIAAWFLGRP